MLALPQTTQGIHMITDRDPLEATCFEQLIAVEDVGAQHCHCGKGFSSGVEAARFRAHALRWLDLPLPTPELLRVVPPARIKCISSVCAMQV